jgi:hypothetical protein
MLVMNYQIMLHYIPEEQRSHLNRGGSLKMAVETYAQDLMKIL